MSEMEKMIVVINRISSEEKAQVGWVNSVESNNFDMMKTKRSDRLLGLKRIRGKNSNRIYPIRSFESFQNEKIERQTDFQPLNMPFQLEEAD